MVSKVSKESVAPQVLEDHQDQTEIKEMEVHLDHLGLKEVLELMEDKDPLDRRDQWVHQETQELTDNLYVT